MADKHGQGDDALEIGSLGPHPFQEWLEGQKVLHGHTHPGMPRWLHEFYATYRDENARRFANDFALGTVIVILWRMLAALQMTSGYW